MLIFYQKNYISAPLKNTGNLNHNNTFGVSESRQAHPKLKDWSAFCKVSITPLTSGDHVPRSLSNSTPLITEPHQLWHNDKPANEEPCCFQSLSQHEQQCQTNKRIMDLLLFSRTKEKEACQQMERTSDTLSHIGRWEDCQTSIRSEVFISFECVGDLSEEVTKLFLSRKL